MEQVHGGAQPRQAAAVSSLAIVGFVALIVIGILATIYAASFIPRLFNGSSTTSTDDGGAAVYLSDVTPEQPADTGAPAASGDIPYAVGTPTGTSVTQTTQTGTPYTAPTQTTTYTQPQTQQTSSNNPVTRTIYRYVTGTSGATTYGYGTGYGSYYGSPDLAIVITEKGYMSGNVFIPSTNVPSGYQGAVKYRVTNNGASIGGSYRVDIRVTTPRGTDTDSVTGNGLAAGASVIGTGRFDANYRGTATIRLTVTSLSGSDTNSGNNTDTESISVRGDSRSGGPIYDGRYNDYDSDGRYCQYGTYYGTDGRYHCKRPSSDNDDCRYYDYNDSYYRDNCDDYDNDDDYNSGCWYDSSGQFHCNGSSNDDYDDHYGNQWYDSNGRYCSEGTYYSGGRYYCEDYDNNNDDQCFYDSAGYYRCY